MALGPAAEDFIKGAATRGMTGLATDLEELCATEAAHGTAALVAIERAVTFGRFRAHDVPSIPPAGTGVRGDHPRGSSRLIGIEGSTTS